jgi:hypothetical protein
VCSFQKSIILLGLRDIYGFFRRRLGAELSHDLLTVSEYIVMGGFDVVDVDYAGHGE